MRHALAIACLSVAVMAASAGEAAAQFGFGRSGLGIGIGIGPSYGGYGGGYGRSYGGGYGRSYGNGYGGYGYRGNSYGGLGNSYYGNSYYRGRPGVQYYNTPGYSGQTYYTSPGYGGTTYYGSGEGYAPQYGTVYSYAPNYNEQAVDQQPRNFAAVTILVPNSDARVWFGDQEMTAHSGEHQRLFHSPALTEGKAYEYSLRASWQAADGQMTDKVRNVDVRSGQSVTVDFGRTEPNPMDLTEPVAPITPINVPSTPTLAPPSPLSDADTN